MTIASVTKAKRVFQALIKLGIEELCEAADSLIAPVRLGVARPTANFSLSNSTIDVVSVNIRSPFRISPHLFCTIEF